MITLRQPAFNVLCNVLSHEHIAVRLFHFKEGNIVQVYVIWSETHSYDTNVKINAGANQGNKQVREKLFVGLGGMKHDAWCSQLTVV